MATSGSIDFTLTARQVIAYALRKLGVLAAGQAPSAEDADDAMEELNVLIKTMQVDGPNLFGIDVTGSQAIVAGVGKLDLTTQQPLRLLEVRYKDVNGREIAMTPLTRVDYWELPNKGSTGVPTSYWFHENSKDYAIYLWPVKANVTTESIEFTFQRKLEDVDSLDDHIDVPDHWLETVGYMLARSLIVDYGVTGERAARITAKAAQLEQDARAFDRDPVVEMRPDERYG